MTTLEAVKERPILFSGKMVRAILDDEKTQTRRVIDRMTGFKTKGFDRSDTNGYDWHFRCQRGMWQDMDHAEVISRCPYGQVGERLWVRESHAFVDATCGLVTNPNVTSKVSPFGSKHEHMACVYRQEQFRMDFNGPWKPSIHMPRWASRITLEITGVRIERLTDISPADCVAEGIRRNDPEGSPRLGFAKLWESINGEGSWDADPWLWVVEFARI